MLLTLTRSVLGGQLGSDGEVDDDDYPEFNPKTDMLDPQFCLGLKFATPKIFRAAVRERAIQKGWIPVFARTDKDKIRVICKADNCPFEMYAGKMQHSSTLQIKTYRSAHTCYRVNENPTIRVPYLVDKFGEAIKLNPNWETCIFLVHAL